MKRASNFSRAGKEPWEEPWIEPLGVATARNLQQPRQSSIRQTHGKTQVFQKKVQEMRRETESQKAGYCLLKRLGLELALIRPCHWCPQGLLEESRAKPMEVIRSLVDLLVSLSSSFLLFLLVPVTSSSLLSSSSVFSSHPPSVVDSPQEYCVYPFVLPIPT